MTATRYRQRNPDLFDRSLAHLPARAAGAATERSGPGHAHLAVAGLHLVADPGGILFHEDERVLLVADLHLEKGSAFAERRRMFLPPYDSAATLTRLAALLARYDPRRVVALGDSFHDPHGPARLPAAARDALRQAQRGRDWLWVAGNHDPDRPAGLDGEAAAEWRLGPLVLRHEPRPGPQPGEIAGHLHPAAVVAGSSGAVRRRVFVSDGTRCVMPAFGAYAGGLNIRNPAFGALFGGAAIVAHALGRDRVYAVPGHRCLAEL